MTDAGVVQDDERRTQMKANDPNALLARDANEAARARISRCRR